MNNTIEQLANMHDRFVQLTQKSESESQDRATIKLQSGYYELENLIQDAKEKQEAMLAGVPDSTGDLEAIKIELMDIMKTEGLTKFRSIYAKMGKKSTVNGARLLNTLGGDIGLFMEIATITQKALKDFSDSNYPIKNELLACIDSEIVMKDLEISFESGR